MRYSITLTCFIFFFLGPLSGQENPVSPTGAIEDISTAGLKAKELLIDLSNPDELDLALKKIHTFRYLESLTLVGEVDASALKKLFYRLSVLRNLTSMTLRENELDKIPENISGIKTLSSLTVEGNIGLDYNDLCVRLKGLPLYQLNLIDNDLRKVPLSISEIASLKKIELSGSNQLDYTAFVEQLAKLPALTTLAIPVNYLAELPKNIDKLSALQVLDVSNNNLMDLPQEISALKAINNLSIQGNLLLDPVRDLEKLKGANIRYLSLDREITGEDLEQVKKMFPDAQIDFPLGSTNENEAAKDISENKAEPAKPIYSGELKAKKEFRILSGAYALYPGLFQGLIYGFDTLGFEARHMDLRYCSTYQVINFNNNVWRAGTFYFRKKLFYREKPGKKNEIWFRFATNDPGISNNYRELRAFAGMYWVYRGPLTKKQFKKMYLVKKQPVERPRFFKRKKKNRPIRWYDIRLAYNPNNSLFVIRMKSDTGFSEFMAYPRIVDVADEKTQPTYQKKFLIYQKAFLRRAQKFNSNLLRDRARYNINYKKMQDYAWKELQLRMSDEEKTMSREEWLLYYDDIIANEQKALDNAPLTSAYILRALSLKGYRLVGNTNTLTPASQSTLEGGYVFKAVNVDFIDSKSGSKLAVTNIFLLDHKNKSITQIVGTLGLLPNSLSLRQFSSYSMLVELRNGNWGWVGSEEIDKQIWEPNKIYPFNTHVVDKNLDTVGDLLKSE